MTPILSPPPTGWLMGLLVLWATLLFGGYIAGRPSYPRDRRMPTWTRIASSLVLVVAAWSWAVSVRITPAAGDAVALLIGVGMTFGFGATA